MIVGLWGRYPTDLKDGVVFASSTSGHLLYEQAKQQGIELITLDMVHDWSTVDKIMLLNVPHSDDPIGKEALQLDKPKYLVQGEHQYVVPENWCEDVLAQFEKVFTWSDSHVDGGKYIKHNYSVQFPDRLSRDLTLKRGFCTLIASNLKDGSLKGAGEKALYSKRAEAIKWFQKHHPDQFDLYGRGWSHYRLSGPWYIRGWNRIKPVWRVLGKLFYPSYKGMLLGDEGKLSKLSEYRYAICYENVADIPGYITEKIIHCFAAGCVPIYWGANNVADHIPANCYIDKKAFNSYEALYDHMINITDEEYQQYLTNIEAFIHSEQGKLFSAEHEAETMLSHIN